MLKRIREIFGRGSSRLSGSSILGRESGAGGDDPGATVSLPPKEEEAPAPAPVHRGPAVVHHPIPQSDLDPEAVKIIRRLTRFDQTAYLVGGCVRDLLLDRRPKDFDIGTSATPRRVKRLFSNCRIIGRRFRLAHIYFQSGKIIEVATFRARDEGEPSEDVDGTDILIRDDNVFGTPEEDALRRDFTINALFYDVNTETVIDHADGLGDLRRKLVRTIGDPGIRFREDPIRILRAIKFAARLGFTIEPSALEAIRKLQTEIPKAAQARVLEEINRFCRGGASRVSFDLLQETGVLSVILPEIAGGYRDNAPAWTFLSALLDALDARQRDGQEASTGEILAVVTLPLLASRLGWSGEGRVTPQPGVLVRELADEYLRPLGLRLRVSRKDQETCRQILMVLHRMVPVHGLRRGAREALLRRPSFRDALRLLDAAASLYDGQFAEAAAVWRTLSLESGSTRRVTGAGPMPPDAPGRREGAAMVAPRGKRRRSRRRRPTSEPAAAVPVSEAPRPAPAHVPRPRREPREAEPTDLPPPWDDRYFFAALPTAESAGEPSDGTSVREAAAPLFEVDVQVNEAQSAKDAASEPPVSRPKRRRRARRRRSPPSGSGASGASEGSEGSEG